MSSLPIHLFKTTLLTNESLSPGITYTDIVDVETAISFAVQLTYVNGSSLTGSALIQATLDGADVPSPVFVDVQQSLMSLTGSNNSILVNIEKHAYSRIRIAISLSAGSADFTVKVNAKRQ